MPTVALSDVLAALKIGASFDWKGALATFEGSDIEAKVVDGLIAADDVAKIVGLFVPPVAVVANDVGVAIALAQALYPLVLWLAQQPAPDTAGQISVWGANIDDPNQEKSK